MTEPLTEPSTGPSTGPRPDRATVLPTWRHVLAVVAHPDDESFGLGALLDAFVRAGATVSVLCLTRGEAGPSHTGAAGAERARELTEATTALGAARTTLLRHPDGALGRVPRHLLADDVIDEVGEVGADGLLVFDTGGVSGHPDHVAATAATLLAAAVLDRPVLGWTLPQTVAETLNGERGTTFTGCRPEDVDVTVAVDRTRQLTACRAHASQSGPDSVLWRRLELLGDTEHLRYLYVPHRSRPADVEPGTALEPDRVRVTHLARDRFRVQVRHHLLTTDQPQHMGGQDTAPTPTELFVAGLAGCVAYYARRYLDRHELPTKDLVVTASWTWAERPARLAEIRLEVAVPAGVPASRRDALLAVASRCSVHNTLTHPAAVTITLVDETQA